MVPQAGEPSRPGRTALFHEHKRSSALLKQMGSGPEVVAAGVSPPSDLSCTVQTLLSAGSTHSSVPFRGGVRLGMSKPPLPRTPQAHTSCREGQGHPCTAAGAQRAPANSTTFEAGTQYFRRGHRGPERSDLFKSQYLQPPMLTERQVCPTRCEWSVGRWLGAERVEAGV